MKPLILSMSAFGPYAEPLTLDFTELGDHSLFLIHGPTGAGKSSILDAMCFALYGETSGGEKEVKGVRSDFAVPEEPTETTFDFLLGDRRYQVFRSPEQDRPKKRGEGVTRQLAQATLYRIDGETRTVLADRWGNVTAEVSRIMGFDVLQFRQVVVLPQGQFRKFLLSGSAERQKILETLFQTRIYRDIEEALKDEAKSLKAAYDEVRQRQALLLEQENAADRETLVLETGKLEQDLADAAVTLEQVKAEETAAQAGLIRAMDIRAKIVEQDSARKALDDLKAREPEIAGLRQRLDRIAKALTLKDPMKNRAAREAELKDATGKFQGLTEQIGRAEREHEQAVQAFEVEKSREGETDEIRSRLETLKGLVDRIAASDEAQKAYEQAVKKTGILERTVGDLRDRAERLRVDIEETAARCQREKDTAARADSLKQRADTLARRVARQKEWLEMEGRKARVAEDLETRKDALKSIEARQDKARILHDETLALFHGGQAALLARTLEKGRPCPVCGSTDHPSPHAPGMDIPDEKILKKTKADLDQLDQKVKEQAEAVRKLREEWTGLASHVAVLENELKDQPDKAGQEQELARVLKELEEARAAEVSVRVLAEMFETLKKDGETKKQELAVQEANLAEALRDVSTLKALADMKRAEIPDGFPDSLSVNREIARCETLLAQRKKALADAETRRNDTTARLAGLRESLAAYRDNMDQCRSRLMDSDRELAARIAGEGFRDRDDVAAALNDQASVEGFSREVKTWDEALASALDRVRRAEEICRNLVLPDVEGLERNLAAIKERLERASGEKSRLDTLLARKTATLTALDQCEKRLAAVEKDYRVTGAMAEVAAGKNPSGMTFQRYVLSALLDDVLYSAGRHLKSMSRNRFDLLRARERSDMRSAGGLDLLVSDDHTGTTRPVATLSGGESFLASLALALGLADVVQAYAGGIRLDTMFVDEGFGSLDPETLDLAFRTFADLQMKGRLVGIISHVPELKERMATRLEVIPGRRGSRARFVV